MLGLRMVFWYPSKSISRLASTTEVQETSGEGVTAANITAARAEGAVSNGTEQKPGC
jgi:hypothetical protein